MGLIPFKVKRTFLFNSVVLRHHHRHKTFNNTTKSLKSILGMRISKKVLLFLVLFITMLVVHLLFLRYQTIITLNHSKIVQILSSQFVQSAFPSPSFSTRTNSTILLDNKNDKIQKPVKILIWNKYWNSKALWHKIFTQIIHGQCPEASNGNNCIFTMNRSELASSDAVLFHLVDLHVNGNYEMPSSSKRLQNQPWIAMTYEPPFILNYVGLNATRLNGVFNRTMTYRSDADIIVRHGRFLKLDQSTTTSSTTITTATAQPEVSSNSAFRFPRYVSNWIHSHEDSKTQRNYATGKRRLIAWFASSHGCTSHSKREHYVSQLQRYVELDVYGSCGSYKCGTQKTLRHPYKVEHDDCYYLVSTSYKFVLAFENSICEDYITEKLYNNLMLNVIPIVLGGGNYLKSAPPHSIIDASQFTPKELAKYLLLLNRNDKLYNEYFEWKKDYYIEAYDGIPFACDLCIKLNNKTWRNEKKIYEEFDSWLMGKCSKGYGD